MTWPPRRTGRLHLKPTGQECRGEIVSDGLLGDRCVECGWTALERKPSAWTEPDELPLTEAS